MGVAVIAWAVASGVEPLPNGEARLVAHSGLHSQLAQNPGYKGPFRFADSDIPPNAPLRGVTLVPTE